MILRVVYTLFIGVLFAILVGVGIAAFYEEPKEPEYPSVLKIPRPEERLSEKVFLELKEQSRYARGIYNLLHMEQGFPNFTYGAG